MAKLASGYALAALVLICAAGCTDRKGPAERLGERVDDAVSDARDRIDDAADDLEDAADDARQSLEDQ
jgi:hypothetical protein